MAIDDPLIIEQQTTTVPGTVVLRLIGPVTLRNLFDLQARLRSGDLPKNQILDLSGVPYMDSAGMGAVINHHVHCENRKVRLIVSGVSPRVLELFRMTRVDAVMSLAASIEEAEASLL
jgi:anti-anti-sigma factor